MEEFYDEALQRVSALPGVLEAGGISELPMNFTGNNSVYDTRILAGDTPITAM